MSEVSLADEFFYEYNYDDDRQDPYTTNPAGNPYQISQEYLSPVDFKTQVLFTLILGAFGAPFFNAKKYELGAARLAFTLFATMTLGAPLTGLGNIGMQIASILSLNEGNFADCDGKLIRQVVCLREEEISPLDQKTTLLMAMFLGIFGGHQFYVGKPLHGVLMLCTLGGLGIWAAVNVYQILTCGFRDGSERVLCPDYIKESLAPQGTGSFYPGLPPIFP